ncbi:MAG TPA: hypothetical protein DCQ25_10890 [Elusimicrobia bacterium]|nr:hypothetical protein [Elusimicrobiota bacterium]
MTSCSTGAGMMAGTWRIWRLGCSCLTGLSAGFSACAGSGAAARFSRSGCSALALFFAGALAGAGAGAGAGAAACAALAVSSSTKLMQCLMVG